MEENSVQRPAFEKHFLSVLSDFKGVCTILLHQDFKWRLLAPQRVRKPDLSTEFSRLAVFLARC